MQKSSLCGREVAQGDGRDPEQRQKVILIGLALQLLLELFARLRVGLFAELLQIGVSKKSVRSRILRIEL